MDRKVRSFCGIRTPPQMKNRKENPMEKVTDLTARLAAPIVEEQGCSLWDVEYVKEAGTWYLRVLIDKEGGVDILDCENISRAPQRSAGRGRPHRRQLYLRGRLRRRRAGAEASRRLPAVSEQPRADEALQAGGRPQGIPRHPDRLQRGRRFLSPWTSTALPIPSARRMWPCAACGWNFNLLSLSQKKDV